MDYKLHTKERFIQRFKSDIDDDDYRKMCELSRESRIIISSERGCIKLISYKGFTICCVLSKKSKIIKTLYPLSKSKKKRINILVTEDLSLGN